MQASKKVHTFLTGPPGIGKTTLVEKACDQLKERGVSLTGFYTKELRNGGQRVGFDIITLDGKHSPLARNSSTSKGPMVGKYVVDVASFESCALPLIDEAKGKICIVDEIGKMELFSDRFKRKIHNILDEKSAAVVFGTIPIKKGQGIPFVENIRERKNVKIFEISRHNRDSILDDIVNSVMSNFG